jgi:hypothetical protein
VGLFAARAVVACRLFHHETHRDHQVAGEITADVRVA